MISPLKLAGQAVVLAGAAAFTGYFASDPVYRQFPEGHAQIKLSFAHGAQRKEACRRLTSKEIAKLPPNERRPNTCSRERLPVRIQLALDGQIIHDASLPPTGLSGDGPSRAYVKFAVPAGRHEIVARLRDTDRDQGFDYETRKVVELGTWQSLAIDFKADKGGFSFR